MELPRFLKRSGASAAPPPRALADAAPQPSSTAAGRRSVPNRSNPEVARARTLARRRLIGSAVLLAVGVIVFPLLFDNRPRPVGVDLPIEVAPRKDSREATTRPVRPLAAASQPAAETTQAAAAGAASPPADPAAQAAPATVAEVPAPAEPVAPSVSPPSASSSASAPPAGSVASAGTAVSAGSAGAAGSAASALKPGTGRFVVQVGAFADAGSVRETRARVEKLGLKTYTQEIDSESGKRTRVRVGPFSTRDEALQAQTRLKEAGLQGNLLLL